MRKLSADPPQDDIILLLLLAAGWALRAAVFFTMSPFNHDPHVDVIVYVLRHHALPPSGALAESFHPPLYYVLAAPFLAWGSPKLVQFFSYLLSVAHLALIWWWVRGSDLFSSAWERRHALAFAALLPQFVIFGSFISNDALAFPLGTLAFLAALAYLRAPRWRTAAATGAALGVGLLTKATFIVFIPGLVLCAVLAEKRAGARGRSAAGRLALILVLAAILGGYKFVENKRLANRWFASTHDFHPDLRSRPNLPASNTAVFLDFNFVKLLRNPYWSDDTRSSMPLVLYATFWSNYISGESSFRAAATRGWYWIPRAVYLFALFPTALLFFGAARAAKLGAVLVCGRAEAPGALERWFALLCVGAGGAMVAACGWVDRLSACFQGRYLFVFLPAFLLLLGTGLEGLRSARRRGEAQAGLIGFYAAAMMWFVVEVGFSAAHW